MCSGVMYTDPDLNVLWYLALRRCSAAAITAFLADWPVIRSRCRA